MREIRTSGSMSGEGKRDVAAWPKSPRPSSTLPLSASFAWRLAHPTNPSDTFILPNLGRLRGHECIIYAGRLYRVQGLPRQHQGRLHVQAAEGRAPGVEAGGRVVTLPDQHGAMLAQRAHVDPWRDAGI